MASIELDYHSARFPSHGEVRISLSPSGGYRARFVDQQRFLTGLPTLLAAKVEVERHLGTQTEWHHRQFKIEDAGGRHVKPIGLSPSVPLT